jgi:metal-responsive CopG/Arc/MetJ family transcriptional regulator
MTIMVTINLPEELAQQLEAIAQRENRPVEDVVASMITKYEPQSASQQEKDAAFEAMFGIYDDDISDMSTTVSETLKQHFRDRDGRTD